MCVRGTRYVCVCVCVSNVCKRIPLYSFPYSAALLYIEFDVVVSSSVVFDLHLELFT